MSLQSPLFAVNYRLSIIVGCVLFMGCGASAPSDEAMFKVTDAALDFESDALNAYTVFRVCGDTSEFINFLQWRERTARAAYQRMIESAPTVDMRKHRVVIADRAIESADSLARQMLDVELEGSRTDVLLLTSDGISKDAACRQSILEATNSLDVSKAQLAMVATAQASAPGRADPEQWQRLWQGD